MKPECDCGGGGRICCPDCDGDGFIVTCCDDLCANGGRCIHGDGEEPCETCCGEGWVPCRCEAGQWALER